MAKKVVTCKKHINGPDAAQKNLNQSVQSSEGLRSEGDKVRNKIKKLIDEEIQDKQRTKKNGSSPSVVARLMGVDMLPSNEANENILINEKFAKNDSIGHLRRNAKSLREKRSVSFDSIEDNVIDQWSFDGFESNKPRRREHPQEEELQRFKEEFEAWLVQKANSTTMAENVKVLVPNGGSLEANCHERVGLQSKRFKNTYSSSAQKNKNVVDNKLLSFQDSDRSAKVDSIPSKIVILRPGPDSISTYEECFDLPRTSRESTSIEEFLEEVKGRLKCETVEKTCKKANSSRGGGIETCCNENPSDPKQIACGIAKNVRESVSRDIGMNLFRSESTRSYRSDLHVNEIDDHEFISRDTRRLLVERLKNVLQHEPAVHENKRSSMLSHRKPRNVCEPKNKLRHLDSLENGSHTRDMRFIREDNGKMEEIQEESSSTRNLIRSLSAPVSGTSFGKLLLEDRNLRTGAHIRRKLEETEKGNNSIQNGRKKDKFNNLKEKVTSFKQSITHKGKLFGRKSQSLEEEHGNGLEIMEDNPSRRSITSFYDQIEDYTEVPPSPASACSFVHEASFQPTEHFSSTSISDVTSTDDNSNAKVYMEISSNLNELQRQLNESDTDVSEQPIGDLAEIEDQNEAYIRDLLLVSGHYDGSIHQSLSILEPIKIQVFEEVEESFKHKTYNNDQCEKLNRKILFDLLNQTLPDLLEPPMSISRCLNSTTSCMTRVPLCGTKLLDQVWKIIRVYVHPSIELAQVSFDSMLDQDLKSSTWCTLMDDDVNAIGKDIECQITRDLIDELVKCMLFRRRRRIAMRKG